MDQPWRVLHVVANHEKRVAQHLAARSLEHYVPLYTEKSRWSDRTVELQRPLFPGYVFVRFAQEFRLAALTTPAVLSVVGHGDSGIVSAAEIDRIRAALARGYLLHPETSVAPGTRVRICRGIFAGAEGTVAELRRNCKVVLSLSGTGQLFSLETEIEVLEVLDPVGKIECEALVRESRQDDPVRI
jgi:transcription antitermination factor NusG